MAHNWCFGPDYLVVKSYSHKDYQTVCRFGVELVLKKGEFIRLFEDDDQYVLFVLKKKGGSGNG